MNRKITGSHPFTLAERIGSGVQGLLLTSVGFSLVLLLVRSIYAGQITFYFLVWNLFLAFVPFYLSQLLMQRPAWIESRWKFGGIFAGWLLFIPNSFYMLTDLFHLYDIHALPRWFDLLLIFCFAWNALLLGILSVRHMEKIVQARWPFRHQFLFIYPVMVLNAAGIYIGRYLRYNSWDIVSNPFRLLLDIGHILLHPIECRNAWAMVLIFSFFLSIIYATLCKLSRSLHY
ncbi:MAG TPA: DUF1361 domain-containing protein [Chitinophagaceae bacterium]|nr:DUF1361 domain-containing protein [Chitinophagaceae bacterium]